MTTEGPTVVLPPTPPTRCLIVASSLEEVIVGRWMRVQPTLETRQQQTARDRSVRELFHIRS